MIQVPQQVLLSVSQFWREFGGCLFSWHTVVSNSERGEEGYKREKSKPKRSSLPPTAAAIILSVRGLVYFLSCYDLQPRRINGKPEGAGVDSVGVEGRENESG